MIAADVSHFAAMAQSLAAQLADLEQRLDEVRQRPADVERDLEIHRLTSRLRTLRRFSLDLCLGRMVPADGADPVYVGRLGLRDASGRRLLVDWRSPAAEPYFAATRARPMGLTSRRRYRWSNGQVTDFWDELLTGDGSGQAALDDESAFIASLGSSRTDRMRDVLGTIQVDQDAIIRAGSRGALVVDGGPGTGKTVVALHRAAYLLYADPRLGPGRGGVLVVGPSRPYLHYVADVLPNLGEDDVLTATVRDLLPNGAAAPPEPATEVARLKSTAAMVGTVEPAVRLYEEPPTATLAVSTPWAEIEVSPADWADAFGCVDPGTPHNDARDQVWEELLTILLDKHRSVASPDEATEAEVRRALGRSPELIDAIGGAWPTLEPTDLVGDLWSVPAYLRHCAPWLSPEEVRLLQRPDPQAWTSADIPLLDAARRRLGDPAAAHQRRRQRAVVASEQAELAAVVDHLIAGDDSEMQVMSMLRAQDLQYVLVDEEALTATRDDPLAGPFAHIIVDEAQELTDAEWQMLLARCPSRSFTVVGDRAQARHGFVESWQERLARVGFDVIEQATLSINYRTPQEAMAEAEPVIRAALPDANVPTSVRSTGLPVRRAPVDELDAILADWLTTYAEGTACVIGAPDFPDSDRVRSLSPELAKGLEFDLVVLVDPDSWPAGIEGAVDRYVAMTRATQQLVILSA